jgi:hypothetical protein
MLTDEDLNKIQILITANSSQVANQIGEIKEEIQTMKRSINLLPTKEEYFDSMDKLMVEVKKVREEQEVIGETLSQHNDRLETLEEKAGVVSSY